MKRLILLAFIALVLPNAVYADSIVSTFYSYSSGQVTIYLGGSYFASTPTGVFILTVTDTVPQGSNGYPWPGTSFYAFCADINHSAADGTASLHDLAGWSDPATYPLYAGAGSYAAFLLDYWGMPSTLANQAAMQVALWEVLYEDSAAFDVDDNTSNIYFTGDAALLTQAQTYLNPLNSLNDTPSSFAYWIQVPENAVGTGVSPNHQDYATPIPEPTSLLLLGAGLLGLGVMARKRR